MVLYLLGLITLPALAGLYLALDWAFSKDSGTGECLVEWCNFRSLELGEHFNLTVWLSQQWHRYATGPKHRRAVIAYWQKRKDQGLPVNPYAEKHLM